MKKLLIITLATMLLLTACQATPEVEIVVQKDMEQMLEKAEATEPIDDEPAALPLRERLGAPERYAREFSDHDGALYVSVDARVDLPDANNMPIFRVACADFEQSTVTALFQRLCGELEMQETSQELTKAEIEKRILLEKQTLEEMGDELSQYAQETSLAVIAELEAQYPSAPESREVWPCTGELHKLGFYARGLGGEPTYSYMGVNAVCPGVANFVVENNNDLSEPVIERDDQGRMRGGVIVRRGARVGFTDTRYGLGYALHPMGAITELSTVPGIAADYLDTTPEEAWHMAEELVKGTNMIPAAIYLAGYQEGDTAGGLTADTDNYAYSVFFRRIIDGIPCALTEGDASGDGDFSPRWYYEACSAIVSDKGVVCFQWSSPHDIIDTVVESTELLPFSSIAEVFDKMMRVLYSNAALGPAYERVEITVSRIELSLQRIREQDSFETGLLVPAWNFYGVATGNLPGEEPDIISNGYGDSREKNLLTLNAIDGSVIDPQKGY